MVNKPLTFIFAFLFCSAAFSQVISPQLKAKDLSILGQGSTPASPIVGYYKLYPKSSDGKFYILNSSGVETVVGGEPAIAAGTTSQYWRGDKSWQSFDVSVRAASFLGLSTATSSPVTATDTVLSGVGKLQAEINTNIASITSNTTAISGKEPAIASGLSTQYWSGVKSWLDFEPAVRSASLLGFSTATNSAVIATDSVLAGLGKLQAEVNTNTASIASNTTSIAGKESTITAGTTAQYWRGDKTFQSFDTSVRAASFLGLSTATSTAVTSTDTVLSAVGKLQAEINTNTASIATRGDVSSNTSSTTVGQLANFADTSGKLLRASTSSGWPKLTSGVPSYFAAISLLTDVSGTLPVSYGGTGNNTAPGAINALLPTQTSNSGKYLTTDGSNVSWATVAGVSGAGDVSAAYYLSGNFAASATVPINYDTKIWDRQDGTDVANVTTSATAWKFTVPTGKQGIYEICDIANHAGAGTYLMLYVNGSINRTLLFGSGSVPGAGCASVRLAVADYIDVRPSASITEVGGALSAANTPAVSITRVGAY